MSSGRTLTAYLRRFFRIFAIYAFAAALPFTSRAFPDDLRDRADADRFRERFAPLAAARFFRRLRPPVARGAAPIAERSMLRTAGVCSFQPCWLATVIP